MAECERCRQAGRQFNAMVRDVKALAAAWNATRARLVAEVERLGRMEAALEDDALVNKIAHDCHSDSHDDRWCSECAARLAGIDAYHQALQAAMKDGSTGKEAGT